MFEQVKPRWLWAVIIVAAVFGLLTIKSGAAVIFFDGAARQAAGHYLIWVVWFNLIAGFFYLIAGLGLINNQSWTPKLSLLIAVSTSIVLIALGLHIANGGLYEMRTVIAMLLRAVIWAVITFVVYSVYKNKRVTL